MRQFSQVQVRFPLSPLIYDVLITLEVAKQTYKGLAKYSSNIDDLM